MKLVFINGAPKSGKDSAGNLIAAAHPVPDPPGGDGRVVHLFDEDFQPVIKRSFQNTILPHCGSSPPAVCGYSSTPPAPS